MDVKKFPADLHEKLRRVQQLIRTDLPRIIGHQAREHFTDNFRRGVFVDKGLHPWPEVKRRDGKSPWYGFEYRGDRRTSYAFKRDRKTGKSYKAPKQKRLNFSPAATTRPILTSKRNLLMNSLRSRVKDGNASVYSTVPHAQIHNEGGQFKVFGKTAATMPKRQFMGHSAELDRVVKQEIDKRIDALFK